MSTFDDNNPATTVCGNCGGGERRLLHHIHHRGSFRRLCTTCVLLLHPQSFCPTCFTVYNHPSSPPNANVTCTNCYSVSHASCVGPTRQHPYTCPMCCATSNKAPIFVLKNVTDLISKGSRRGAHDFFTCPNDENGVVIDLNAARILVAAATISSLSMRKAEMAAKFEAGRRAKEAAEATKRAKHALQHMAAVVSYDEKMKKNEGSRIEVPVVQFRGNVGGGMERTQRRDRYSHDGGGGSLERNRVLGNLERLKRSSNGTSVRDVTRVELRENGVLGGIRDNYSDYKVENGGGGSLDRNRVSGNLERLKKSLNWMSVRDVTGVELRETGVLGGIRDSYSYDRVENGGGGLLERNQVLGSLERLERSSNGVLVRDVTGVELRETGVLGGIRDSYSHDRVENRGGDLLERNPVLGSLERLERSSNGVLVRDVAGVELRENGGLGGFKAHSSVVMGPSSSNSTSTNMHDQRVRSLGSSIDIWNSRTNLKRNLNGMLIREMNGGELRENRILEGIRF
ncbi:hypothetical protein LIER_28456 [Lithospermum erythrorhizon]|uniref:Uncharacterized protein n=1 Tax=Lithospermum erythrorhizon TaxID=34254 RepID=A0AAV3RJB1_LITER